MQLKAATTWAGKWIRGHRKLLIGGLIGLAVLSVAIQLVYPYGRALPFATVAGQSVGYQQRPAITLAIQNSFTGATATLRSGKVELSEELASLGARVEADSMASHAVSYPLIFRFVPFSLLWYQPHLDRYQLEFDKARLDEMSQAYAKKLSQPPVDAGINLDGSEIKVTKSRDGQSVSAEKVHHAIATTTYNWGDTLVEVDGQVVEPAVSNASVADIRDQVERVLAQPITIIIDGQTEFKPDRPTVASWLTLHKDKRGLSLTGDDKALNAYAATVAGKTSKKPSETVVTTLDSQETNRQSGRPGRGIVPAELVKSLNNAIQTPRAGGVALSFARKPIQPPVRYIRSYSNSQAGLQAYAKDLAERGNIQIAIQQLTGGRWSAEGEGDKSLPSASTYKPLLMLRVFDDINRRKLRWNDKIGDETVQQCFERMIVLSANECAEALIKRYGVRDLTDYLHSEGFSKGTGFTFSEATQTTANDLAKFMVGLQDGDLFTHRHRDMMLEKMSRQIFRQGISAGTKAKTYSKVGFLWDYLHDMAIVDHPKGTYVLVVMTKGESWQKIADTTRDVEAILYGDGLKNR